MNWKLPNQLRWIASGLRDRGEQAQAEICEQAAQEIELDRLIVMREPIYLPIEEGDRANG